MGVEKIEKKFKVQYRVANALCLQVGLTSELDQCNELIKILEENMTREFIGTIKAKHVRKSFFRAFDDSRFLIQGFGRICLCDVGKRVYMDNNFPVMENNEQRDSRVLAERENDD